jgi:hypothetical protein
MGGDAGPVISKLATTPPANINSWRKLTPDWSALLSWRGFTFRYARKLPHT